MSSRVKDNDARAHRLIERVVAEKPDFIINAGDHIDGAVFADPAERQLKRAGSKARSRFTCPNPSSDSTPFSAGAIPPTLRGYSSLKAAHTCTCIFFSKVLGVSTLLSDYILRFT